MTEPYVRTTRDAEEFFPFMCFGGLRKMCLTPTDMHETPTLLMEK